MQDRTSIAVTTVAPMETLVQFPWLLPTRAHRSGLSEVVFLTRIPTRIAHDQRMTFMPQIRINDAIRFQSNFDLASIRQKYNHRDYQTNGPLDRWYQDRTSANAFDTAMIPSINQWHLTAQLPWGVLSIGPRSFPWGTGAMGGFNTRNDGMLFVTPYGPFRFLAQIYFANWPDGYGTFIPYAALGSTGPGANSVVNYDGGEHNSTAWALAMTYDSGPLSFGCLFLQRLLHANNANLAGSVVPVAPELGLAPTAYRIIYPNPTSNVPVLYGFGGFDLAMAVYNVNLKYNNGRFFLNAEYAWANVDAYFLGIGTSLASRPGANYSGGPQYYTEAALSFLETGALCGPAKFAFMFAWSGGLALNNGNPTKSYNGIAINNQATDAYNYLLFHTYGGGNDAPWNAGLYFTNDENGQMSDAYALAARSDYAVAANLNIWGSYMWASRVEQNGWFAGQKNYNGVTASGTGATLPDGTNQWTAYDAQHWKATYMPGSGAAANMNPYVDDRYLGWEANVGVDWKLLENMTVMSRYAYWQPGPWFDQAYQVVGVSNGVVAPTSTAGPGAYMQGRSAIQCFTSSVMIDF